MNEFLISLLVVCGIGTVLAFLLEFTAQYLTDYGESHILINDEKDLLINAGRSLLASLNEEKIFLPSACGGKGTCAYCKVKVHEGGGPILPTETPYLSPEEIGQHVRLGCQVKVKGDLKIEVPEELFRIREYSARVVELKDLTPDIKGLSLEIPQSESGLTFRPGQYLQLEVPKYKYSKVPEYRAYSIASAADQPHRLELVITKAPKGVVSTYVHDFLKKGDEIVIRGPYGDFYLRESENPILMVATGSGLAPMRSILHQIESDQIDRKTSLFFGERTREDLFYYEELKALEKKMKNFTFVPTLSRPAKGDGWKGETGRVTDLIGKYLPDQAKTDVYLCGAPAMIESCLTLLKQKGIPRENIFFDKFE